MSDAAGTLAYVWDGAGRVTGISRTPAGGGVRVWAYAYAGDGSLEVVADGEWWDRVPVPFHVVLQSESADDLERRRSSGADVTALELS
jgi:hypothetical protein